MKGLVQTATAAIVGFALLVTGAIAQTSGDVYTVAKYPVDASAANAVAAKRKAMTEGRKSAFRSLLKKLVPAPSYGLISQLLKLDPEPYIGSVSVRKEENSSTQYIATLDFSFDGQAVRGLLGQHGVPYFDNAAPTTSLLLLYKAPKKGGEVAMSAAKGGTAWRNVWRGLDLANSIAPVKLVRLPAELTQEVRAALLAADAQTLAAIGSQYSASQLVVAEAVPVPASKELHVTLAGQDAVARFAVTTRYRLDDEDFTYSLELAAVIAQGVLEGRWKTQQSGGLLNVESGGAMAAMTILAEFNNLGQWHRQQQTLSQMPGVRNLQVGSLSGRSASVSLSYPGGGQALQAAIGRYGLVLENINGFWVLR